MNKIPLITSLILSLMLMACGAQQADSLAKKKETLATLRQESMVLNQRIAELEADIAKLDTNAIKQAKEVYVSIEQIESRTFKHFVDVQGTIEANRNVMISPQTSGNVTQIYVNEGQIVKKGQILAQLDASILKSSIDEVNTSLELANILYEKQEKLWDQEIGTEVQLLTAKNQKESLEKKLKTLEVQLGKTKVRAPFSGTIDAVITKTGELLSPGMPAFQIVSGKDLSLKAKISEIHAPYIKKGDEVKLEFPVIDKSFDTRISSVGQSINPNDRTFAVEIKLANDPLYKANMYGNISINDRILENVIVVPLPLVQKSERGEYVYVAVQSFNQWVAERRSVKLGLSYDGQTVIDSGLKVGDKLILSGDVSDGVVVKW